jgi:hypothetical protein
MKTQQLPIALVTALTCILVAGASSQPFEMNASNSASVVKTNLTIPDTKLILELNAPKQIAAGSRIRVEGKIKNEGNHAVLIYMPGLSLFPSVDSDVKKAGAMRPDELGMPMVYGRAKSAVEDQNFVLLEPGDCYGRIFECPALGSEGMRMNFSLTYENSSAKRKLLWVGKASVVSGAIPVGK